MLLGLYYFNARAAAHEGPRLRSTFLIEDTVCVMLNFGLR